MNNSDETNKLSVISVSKSYKTYEGTLEALKNVSFSINEGTTLVIGGENGSGKSVLMNIIAGLEKPDSGTIEAYGKAGLVFQEADTQILGETPREDIALGPKNQKKSKNEIKSLVENSLIQTNLTNKADFPARFLSGGQKRRLAVACMLAMENPIIIFDEPYANLDYSGVKQVNALIQDLQKQKKTIIILTHELEKCLGLADKFIVLFRGDKVFEGTPQEGLNQNLEIWNIRNPLTAYNSINDLIWK